MKTAFFIFALVFCRVVYSQENNHLVGSTTQPNSDQNTIETISEIVSSSVMEVLVYPNPSEGVFSVSGIEGSTVTLYSTSGTYVGTWMIGQLGLVQISDIPEGSYFCAVTKGEYRTVKKMVVL